MAGDEPHLYEGLEPQPSKHMKKEIDQWRAELFATGNFDREQLEELEGHLWDEIDHMDSSALSPEEKLIIAQKLIGTASD